MLVALILDARSRRIAIAVNQDPEEVNNEEKLDLDDIEEDEKPNHHDQADKTFD